jgi:hypothetical protein
MRYYFHLRVGKEVSADELGVELPDLDAAYLEAFQAAQGMWGELLAERSDPLIRSFEIADASGRVLLTLPFREVLERARKPAGPLPNEVTTAHAHLEKARTLAESLNQEIRTAQETIASARRSMQQSQGAAADRFPLRSNERG